MGEADRILRFGVVGLTATAVHVTVFFVLTDGFAVDPTLATAVAFLGAMVVSYLANRRWTFRFRGAHRRTFGRYATVAVVGAALNALIMRVATTNLGWHKNAGLLAVLAVVPAFSYLGNRYWSFRRD
jgi:putative flippase GtrA